jgi:predicted aconitase
MGATRLLEIDSGGHFSPADPIPAVGMRLEMLEELVDAGLRTTLPFTLDPRGPVCLDALSLSAEERRLFADQAEGQPRYLELMLALGLRDDQAYTCTPYLPEVGNCPPRDAIVAWSESSCVVFANSVLGARTNRTPAIVDLFSNIVGYTPEFGLLTDDGRRATWRIDVTTRSLPAPQVLGAFIAECVVADVPYVVGLDALLSEGTTAAAEDYLKEMGAACAAVGGAVGLVHVEGITPEAVEHARGLLVSEARRVTVDEADLERFAGKYRAAHEGAPAPERCVIGCPQLSSAKLDWWVNAIAGSVHAAGAQHVAVQTILSAAPQVLGGYLSLPGAGELVAALGIEMSTDCLEAFMDNPACARRPTVTTSNKLRAYTTARLLGVDEILAVIAGTSGGGRG